MKQKCDACRAAHPCGVNNGPCVFEFDMLDASMLPENCPFDIDKIPDFRDALPESLEPVQQTDNTASAQCLCETCSRLLSNGGTCQPNTNSFVTACGGFTKSQRT